MAARGEIMVNWRTISCIVESRIGFMKHASHTKERTEKPLTVRPALSRAAVQFVEKHPNEVSGIVASALEAAAVEAGLVDMGAPTDAVRARHFAAGQALGRAVHEEHRQVDGFIYASRLTGDDCIAVFERAVGKMRVDEAGELKDQPELPGVERNKVVLVE
jgi:RES domain